ncbi:hypothetical protein [Kitasatospora sp. NPDC093806]|uniref:hypothetical protein n=1 Tax=Kitasatospora sp. NPDC093806 TaxID=3155075 RepID=UPI00341E6A1B
MGGYQDGYQEHAGTDDPAASRRRVWAARWTVVGVAGAALAVVLATSGDGGGAGRSVVVTVTRTPATAPGPATATAPSLAVAADGDGDVVLSVAGPPRREVTPGVTPADPGPAAVVGRPYPVDWSAHCDLAHLRFAGRTWKAPWPPALPSGLPGPRGAGSGPPVLPGYATLTAPDRLRFEAPGYLPGPVLLEPTAEERICE